MISIIGLVHCIDSNTSQNLQVSTCRAACVVCIACIAYATVQLPRSKTHPNVEIILDLIGKWISHTHTHTQVREHVAALNVYVLGTPPQYNHTRGLVQSAPLARAAATLSD
jgi:hypothetical protein